MRIKAAVLAPATVSAVALAVACIAPATAQSSQGVRDANNAGIPAASDAPVQTDPAIQTSPTAPTAQTPPAQQPVAGDDAAPGPDVVVTGIRASLASSLATKRNAANVVDSITAEEAGKFPENNLAESLQRIAGVSVVRSFGLGQQVSVRGLGPDFSNVLLNGRTLPSDTGGFVADGGGRGRSFNFDVLPSEMISRLDVNKTTLPMLTEGGIGSTINILTPRPLSGAAKTYGSLTVQGNYVSKVNTVRPTVSGIYSWVNPAGNFGVTVSGSYTDLRASQDYTRIGQWDNANFTVVGGTPQNPTFTQRNLRAPRQISFGQVRGGTKRYFGAGAVQWRPTETLLLTADGFYTQLKQRISDSILNPVFGNVIANPVVSSNGVLTSGTYLGQGSVSNAALGAAGISAVRAQSLSVIRARDRTAKSYDIGFNAAWKPNDRWTIEGDASFAKSTGKKAFDPYFLVGNYTQGDIGYSFEDGNPRVTDTSRVYTDPSLARIASAENYGQTVTDLINEGRAFARYNLDTSIVRTLEIGGDYQDHSKSLDDFFVNDSGAYSQLNTPFPTQFYRPVGFGGNFMDGMVNPPSGSFVGYDPAALAQYLSNPANRPAGASGTAQDLLAPQFNAGGSFVTREKVSAGYFNTTWKTGPLSGNIGVRVVHVDTSSTGNVQTVTQFIVNNGNYSFNFAPGTNISQSANYTSALPSTNIRLDLTDRLSLRFGAGRTLTRADLNDLRLSENFGFTNGQVTVGRGNPGLKPQYGNNYDLSAEWYISSTNYVSAAIFRKDLTNLFQQRSFAEPYSSALPNAPTQITVVQTQNVNSGRIQGVEVAGQYILGDRFGWASGFGVTGNYTHVNARTDGASNDPSNCGFTGVSPDSYNASGFYDNGTIQTRLSYNWRSRWITTCNWNNEGVPQRHDPYGQLDLALRFNLTRTLQLFADAQNLTNADNYVYGDVSERFVQRDVNYRRFDVGVHLSF